jgi:hypothetical protein
VLARWLGLATVPLIAAATAHLGAFAIVLLIGFAIGGAGHLSSSKVLVVIGILVIAAVSLYFVAAGEVQTFGS